MRSPRLPLAALALAVSACSLAPRYQRPAAPVPPAVGAEGAPGAAAAVEDLGWRDVFGDERLKALVALALQNNRDLRVAALNVELARAQYRIQRAEQLPAVNGTASGTRQRVPADLSTSGRAVTVTSYTVGLGATAFELDLFGRVRSLSTAALEQYLATDEARRSAHLALVAEVATQYLVERALDDQVALARRTLEAVEASYALNKRTYEGGRTSELDVRIAETQVLSARINLSNALEQRAQAEHALVLLVGQPLPADLPPPMPLDAQPFLADLPPGVPSDVLLRRPDILAAEHALRGANAVIGAARAAFFPSITLTAFAGSSSADLSGLFGSGAGMWSFTPRIDVPIFRGGELRASLDVANVRKSIQIAQYERAIQGAFREVADALVARSALEEQLVSQRARVDAEQRRYELSDLRYRKGVDSYLGVLQAQRDLFAAQQLLIQSRLARLTNLVDLYRALGGGWRERSEPAAAQASAPAAAQGS
ncbi:efflux transporter outer membrane subunit [Anaeromyxobacter oryzae]|uniref:AdeC/adeK/oprM family multidrug efflux complex outer membrane factor n=1 Tax=Anaeromyxobacter oryzae TaxID=2918170 RepID=A0ABN6N0Q8_9BACT|nr:efflux transporter outer membrane subunit [Anaeromyxobacter oryzae]BDG05583.1 adeC/adeK/oprM family multidrug efflux complex outer membrane factor [Anaeromyxobacter oryzae]